jgi:hypothetical protein
LFLFKFKKTTSFLFLFQVVEEISNLLETGLDKETLSICVRLIENGINPSALAHAILEIRKDAAKISSLNE